MTEENTTENTSENTSENTNMVVDNLENNYIGRVNWINRRKGFGFITIVTPDNELTNTDVFFHFSAIKTDNYKIVYPGEYVSFSLVVNDSDTKNRNICKDITGLFGNKLLTDNDRYNIRISEKKDLSNQ